MLTVTCGTHPKEEVAVCVISVLAQRIDEVVGHLHRHTTGVNKLLTSQSQGCWLVDINHRCRAKGVWRDFAQQKHSPKG